MNLNRFFCQTKNCRLKPTVFHSISRFLYKLITAFRAGDLNLAFSSGHPDLLRTGGAFEKAENLCLLSLFAFLVEVFKQRPHDSHKTFVFPLSFPMVMGKEAKQAEQQRKETHRIQHPDAFHRNQCCDQIDQQA